MFKKKKTVDEAKIIEEEEEAAAKAREDEDAEDNEDNAERDTEKDANESVDAATKSKGNEAASTKRSYFVVRCNTPILTNIAAEANLGLKKDQEKDKIGSKRDKNGKRREAERSLKQLQ
nr:hypothetical protein [Tanacetum cinerariifolium]